MYRTLVWASEGGSKERVGRREDEARGYQVGGKEAGV